MDEHDFLKDKEEDKKHLISKLTQNLLDLKNPETISFIKPNENDILSLIKTLAYRLKLAREEVGLKGENILLYFINQNFITRFSIKGERSKQLVQILSSIREEDNKNDIGKVLKEKMRL